VVIHQRIDSTPNRLRFSEAGVDAALADEAPTEREPLLNDQQEGHLVALACSAPPDGRERWTLAWCTTSRWKVCGCCCNKQLKPWQVRQWCIPRLTATFIEQMEAILRLYTQLFDPNVSMRKSPNC
jgi:hypothetical protein